jgi:hypothetical protein
MNRREFLQTTLGGTVLYLGGCAGGRPFGTFAQAPQGPKLVSPGCRGSKVKIARLYLGIPKALYPNPAMDLAAERKAYDTRFATFKDELCDVDFIVDELVGSPEQLAPLKDRLRSVDGILAIHLTLGTLPVMKELLALGRPTMILSPPYAGHEWYYLSDIRRSELGRRMECALTTDPHELAAAVRPFRAMHHLREAKVLNVAAGNSPATYPKDVKDRFGTEIALVGRQRVLDAYNSVSDEDARAEALRWTHNATAVVEPSKVEILASCKLALAFQKLMDEENATVITVDCYGSMWRQLPAYPCVGFARLNDMGLGGVCQSDLPCVMVHILFQGLTGRPSFVCNPTFDFATNSATLIHCLGCTKMDGPNKPAAPYKLRSVMEREEGVVPQVRMRVGQPVTQAIFADMSTLRYFTGKIVDTPETDRGCRTKITVKVDGNAEKLWQNWSAGIHRVSCYGDVTKDLARFCRFADLKLANEAT